MTEQNPQSVRMGVFGGGRLLMKNAAAGSRDPFAQNEVLPRPHIGEAADAVERRRTTEHRRRDDGVAVFGVLELEEMPQPACDPGSRPHNRRSDNIRVAFNGAVQNAPDRTCDGRTVCINEEEVIARTGMCAAEIACRSRRQALLAPYEEDSAIAPAGRNRLCVVAFSREDNDDIADLPTA